MKVNLWRSTYSDQVYEMPTNWLPKFGGWDLVATVEKTDKPQDMERSENND